jgi:surfeit locus 1 family protein
VRIGTWLFAPAPVPTVAAFALIALTTWLGLWQDRRATEKTVRQALLEARVAAPPLSITGAGVAAEDLLFRRLRAQGRYDADGQFFVDNRIHGGRAGYHVMTPFRLSGSDAILLVNRGWVARSASYPAPPAVPVPPGERAIAGLAVLPPARFLELSADAVEGAVWQNLSMERYGKRVNAPVVPVVLLVAPPGEALAAVEEQPDAGIAKHREYSLTWFSLAVTAAVLWVALNLRKAGRG